LIKIMSKFYKLIVLSIFLSVTLLSFLTIYKDSVKELHIKSDASDMEFQSFLA